jgi:AraC-like DNA-binding protein
MSESHFIRAFRKETGLPPHAFILQARLSLAKYMLETTGLSIKEISFNTGFNSESHFISAFKRVFSTTPQKHRKTQD